MPWDYQVRKDASKQYVRSVCHHQHDGHQGQGAISVCADCATRHAARARKI